MKPIRRYSFSFFTHTTQHKSGTTKWPVVEQRQDQHKVSYVWSIGVLFFLLREIKSSTQVIWKNVKQKMSKKVDFPDIIFNFSKILYVLHSTSCMTGELWQTRFIWHQDIRVTHRQYSAYFCLHAIFFL